MKSLPEGLVTTTGDAPSKLDGLDGDGLEVGSIAHLWKAYNTNPSAHQGTVGHRLENFFWRIWGSKLLLGTLHGSTLAKLFQRISDGSQALAFIERSAAEASASSSAKKAMPSEKKSSRQPLPPILKKPNSSSQGDLHSKTTRLLLTDPEGQNFTRNPSNPPTPVPPSVPFMGGAGAGGGETVNRQKKTVFMTNTATKNTRRRPVVMRRKSARSGTAAHTHSPEHPSPLSSELWVDMPDEEEQTAPEKQLTEEIITPPEPVTIPTTTTKPDPGINIKPKLPSTFVASLKTQIKADPPSPSSSGNRQLIDPDLWYNWYRQPSKAKLVNGNFRNRFTSQIQHAQYAQQLASSQVADSEAMMYPGFNEAAAADRSPFPSTPPPHTPLAAQSFENISPPDSGCALLTTSSPDVPLDERLGSGAGSSPGAGSGSKSAMLIPTPRSSEMVTGLPSVPGVSARPTRSQPGITMDVTFEELEELSPMVW